MKFLLSVAISLMLSVCVYSQKKFVVTMSFPQTLDVNKLKIQVDNGFGRLSTDFTISKNNEITISGLYYSEYAAIVLNYPKTQNMNFRTFFFLDERPAKIKFDETAPGSSPLEIYTFDNAYDFKIERDNIDTFNAGEVKELNNFLDTHGGYEQIFKGDNKDLAVEVKRLENNIYKKNIEYVKNTSNSYFSFWHFRSNVQYSGLAVDSILTIFDNTFPDTFKKSIEGNAFRQLLVGKLETKKGNAAAQFVARDINGRTVDLSSFKGNKYVLLDFWATWCGPCLEKMPLLGRLHERFSKDFEVISIAYPTTLEETKNAIAKHKMSWVNIYNDAKLINSYGGMGAIPRLFLIDKTGTIIYDNHEDGDPNLQLLTKILEQALKDNS